MYLGWAGVVLLAFCLGGLRDARSRALLLVCGLSVWGMLSLNPEELTAIPFIRAQGSFTRARLLVLMVLAVVSGSQIQRIFTAIARRAPRGVLAWVTPLFAVASIVLAFDLSRTNVARHVLIGSEQHPPSPRGPYDVAPDFRPVASPRASIKVEGVSANHFEYLFSSGRGNASALFVAPNLSVSPRPPHLKLVGDGTLTSYDGSLAVRTSGSGRFALVFDDLLTTVGLVVSSLALLGLVGLALGRRWRRTRRRVC